MFLIDVRRTAIDLFYIFVHFIVYSLLLETLEEIDEEIGSI